MNLFYTIQAPYNTVKYSITNEDIAAEYFMINEFTGQMSVKKGLYLDEEQSDSYSVSNNFYLFFFGFRNNNNPSV